MPKKVNNKKMKKLFILSLALTIASCSNDKSTSNNTITNPQKEEPKNILKEELPPLKTCNKNVGRLKMNDNGYSIGNKTELTELRKQLKNKDCDIIEIVWVWVDSYDMPMKIVYNKTTGNLKQICTGTNVIEEYTNVSAECLEQLLKHGEKSLSSLESYCNAKYDYNNREMKQTAIGAKPEQSELDGSVKIVKDYIKTNAKDASSIDFLEWSKVSSFGVNWIVRCKYKGTNSFGGVVTENIWFYIQNSKVVDTKAIQ